MLMIAATLGLGCSDYSTPDVDAAPDTGHPSDGAVDTVADMTPALDSAPDAVPDSCSAMSVCGGAFGKLGEVCVSGSFKKLPKCVEPYSCPTGHTCDYSTLHAVDAASADKVQKAVVNHIWAGKGFPKTTLPTKVEALSLSQSPISGVSNLAALTQLTVTMPLTAAEGGGCFTSYAVHFRPQTRLDRLVVYHQGHSWSMGPNGGDATVRFLVKQGFDVVGLMMPLKGKNSAPAAYKHHNDIMKLESSTRCALQFFLEPVAVALNHLRQQHTYKDVSMIGISGGGWTTTLYAAADPTVRFSFPVAGSVPLDLPNGSNLGDGEQKHPQLYKQVASYRDLYVLGGAGKGRAQVQVLSRFDNCCFSGINYRAYENRVRAVARTLGGSFDVYLDATHKTHQISQHVLEAVVLPRLMGQAVWVLEERDDGHGYPGSVYGGSVLGGTWTASSADGFGGSISAAAAGSGDTATWTFGHLRPGDYRVSVSWTAHTNRATNAPFSVFDGTTSLGSYTINQQQAPASRTALGASWQDLGQSHTITGKPLTVKLTNLANDDVIADAVMVELLKAGPRRCVP
jgi:hypothetical protein